MPRAFPGNSFKYANNTMLDPFATLGLEPRFNIDAHGLEQRHRELSRALHPDRFSGAPAAERRLSLNRAIEVNDAFRLLRDPIRRAEALLRLANIAVGEREEPKASPTLLMDMMESREALAEAAHDKDLQKIQALGEAMQKRQQSVLTRLGHGFDEAKDKPEALKALVPLLGELRYIRRFLDEVSAYEEELVS